VYTKDIERLKNNTEIPINNKTRITLAGFLISASFTAIFYLIPILFPFFTPTKRPLADLTYFEW
jgi:hypothetical protein